MARPACGPLRPLGGSRCPGTAGRLGIRWGGAPGSDGQLRSMPGLHAPREDGDHRKVVLSEQLCGSDRAPLGLSHRDHGSPAVGDALAEPARERRQGEQDGAVDGPQRAGTLLGAAHSEDHGRGVWDRSVWS